MDLFITSWVDCQSRWDDVSSWCTQMSLLKVIVLNIHYWLQSLRRNSSSKVCLKSVFSCFIETSFFFMAQPRAQRALQICFPYFGFSLKPPTLDGALHMTCNRMMRAPIVGRLTLGISGHLFLPICPGGKYPCYGDRGVSGLCVFYKVSIFWPCQ